MKKIIAFVIAMILVFLLVGCSNSTNNSAEEYAVPTVAVHETVTVETEEPTEAETTPVSYSDSVTISPEEFPDFIKDYVDLSHYNDAQFGEGYCTFIISSEYISNAELFSDYTIKLENNISVKLGDKVSVLLNQGAKYADEDDKNKILEKQQGCTVYLKIGDKQFHIDIENNSDKTIPYSDATVSSISVLYYNYGKEKYKDAMDFNIENKISQNDDLRSIISKLGEPRLITLSKKSGLALLYSEEKDDGSYNSYNTCFNLSEDGTKLCIFNIRH